jgi:hypothetical protein
MRLQRRNPRPRSSLAEQIDGEKQDMTLAEQREPQVLSGAEASPLFGNHCINELRVPLSRDETPKKHDLLGR